LPARLTGPGKLPVPWEQLHAAHPSAVDAVGSPDGKFLVLIEAGRLVLVAHDAVVTEAKTVGNSVVMTEWALGRKNVERWEREAAAALRTAADAKRK
jgi:hypothetical protein